MTTKPKNKHERNAAKALARSKRNSPPKKSDTRKPRRIRRGFRKVGKAFEGMAAAGAALGAKGLAVELQKVQEAEQKRRIELDGMKKDELKDIARPLKVRRFTTFTKAELIEAIIKTEGF